MTTTVIVKAHCSIDKEVAIVTGSSLGDKPEKTAVIQNGEEWSGVVYDDYVIAVTEIKKGESL